MSTEPGRGYEVADAAVPTLFKLGGVLAIIVLGALAGTLGLLRLIDTEAAHADVAPLAERRLPPDPRLQARPGDDLAQLRRWEDEQLQTYGWVERRLGAVRLPIERAMELVIEQGPGAPPRKEHGK